MVEYLKYKNENLPIRLSYRVFKGIREDEKTRPVLKAAMEANQMVDQMEMDPDAMEAMLWHGLRSGFLAEGKELTLKREDMEDVLDECFMDFLALVPVFFPKAKMGNALKNLQNQPNGEAVKALGDSIV